MERRWSVGRALYKYPPCKYPLYKYPAGDMWPALRNRWQVLAPSSVDVVYDTVGEADTGAHAMEVSVRCPVTWGSLSNCAGYSEHLHWGNLSAHTRYS